MKSNEKLRLAYVSFCLRYKGTDTRVRFSKMLGLVVGPKNRTSTLNKWLSPDDATDFRACPEHVAKFAAVMNCVDQMMPYMVKDLPVPDHLFWQLAEITKEVSSGTKTAGNY